jgi:hypothetical protein
MPRAATTYTVTDNGRDKGKVFVLTELPASQAEAWAMRALLALTNAGVDIPVGFERMGMAGMAQVGIRALGGLKWEVAEPLLAEMWQCVQFQPDPSKPNILRPVFEEDIEDISTRIKLRAEVWKLHADFLKAVAPSMFDQDTPQAAANNSRNTKTSRR